MNIPDIKGCPFCGAKPVFNKAKRRYCQLHGDPLHQDVVLACQAMRCSFKPGLQAPSKLEAVQIWNTRHEEVFYEHTKKQDKHP